jgi:hypothetical protein
LQVRRFVPRNGGCVKPPKLFGVEMRFAASGPNHAYLLRISGLPAVTVALVNDDGWQWRIAIDGVCVRRSAKKYKHAGAASNAVARYVGDVIRQLQRLESGGGV